MGKAQGKLLPFPEDAPDDYVAALNAEQEVERQRIAADPIRVAGQSLQLTISQGLAVRRDGDDDHTLLQRADAAMYQAKQRGRNCVEEEPDHAARR